MTKQPRILFYDIETAPHTALVWGKYEQNALKFQKYGEMLSFAYSWNDGKINCITREKQGSDKALVKKLHDLFNEADIIVAHNGDNFDVKRTNTQSVKNRVAPHKNPPSVDTLKVARKHFSFPGNSLSDLAAFLGVGTKLGSQPISMWVGCMEDKPSEWAKMARYNKHDVVLLRKVYHIFKPWMSNHPSILKTTYGGCRQCGHHKLQKRGIRLTTTKAKQTFECMNCGHWSFKTLTEAKR